MSTAGYKKQSMLVLFINLVLIMCIPTEFTDSYVYFVIVKVSL